MGYLLVRKSLDNHVVQKVNLAVDIVGREICLPMHFNVENDDIIVNREHARLLVG